MQNKDNSYNLIDNTEEKQYEFHIDTFVARIEYIKAKNNIYLTHTDVPKELENKGIGSKLVNQVFRIIEQNNLTLIPLCPFVATYIKRHPEWRKLVMKGINIT
ncbi:MAG: N-acetyltransferase [Calditrichaeota bacterium]|nr:N-acetyltransferase [Calditrichota bacterium]